MADKITDCLSLGLIFALGFIVNLFLNKIKIPGIVGMIIIGYVIGPDVLNLISNGIMTVNSELRTITLLLILSRGGLNLDTATLKKIGRPAILMSFIPAILEMVGGTFAAIWLLDLNKFECMLLSSVLGSLSPAICTSKMFMLIDKRYGEKNNAPKLVFVGASIDGIVVIVLFNAFLPLAENSHFNGLSILAVPISLILGILLGFLVGFIMYIIYTKTKFDTYSNFLFYLSMALLLKGFENYIDALTNGTKVDYIKISSFLSIIVTGIIILYKLPEKAKELSSMFSTVFKFFEILLFILVGVNMSFNSELKKNVGLGIAILFIGLLCRAIGAYLCVIKTPYNIKEKIFIMVSYLPKATIQASIGGIPAARGMACGNLISGFSAISIIIAGTIGALLIELLGPILLEQTKDENVNNEIKENSEIKESKKDTEENDEKVVVNENEKGDKMELSENKSGNNNNNGTKVDQNQESISNRRLIKINHN